MGNPIESRATGIPVVDAVLNTVNTGQWATDLWGWITEQAEWAEGQLTQLDHLVELVTNNVLTKAIRGLNELMTAIQTDISDVLGTLETLTEAPMDIIGDIMDIVSIPKSIFGMVSNIGGEFMGIYEDAMGVFNMLGDAQALGKGMGGAFDGAGGAYGFMNQMSGMNTKLNSNWLSGSRTRDNKVRKWGKAKYGQDAIQMQSTEIDILTEMLRQAYRAEDMASMQRLQGQSESAYRDTVYRARTAKTATQTRRQFHSQLAF